MNVTALVRKVGAIGIFEIRPFTLIGENIDPADHDAVVAAWLEQHGKEWELNHLETIEGKPTFNTMK